MHEALAVSLGAVCGALARHNVATFAAAHSLTPWHIACVNVGGSAALGAIAASPLPKHYKLCLGVGACGAFTTFSTFATDVVAMVEAEQFAKAASYVAANNFGSIGAAFGSYHTVQGVRGLGPLASKLRKR